MIVVDRFEENFAVLEKDGATEAVPREALPPEAREGDLLLLEDGVYRVDPDATRARRAAMRARFARMKTRREDP